jgi:hypothetical protein
LVLRYWGCPKPFWRAAIDPSPVELGSVVRSRMPRILVIHGAGMNMRGKVHVDVFGPMTLAGFGIAGYALALRGLRDRPAAKREA